MVDRPSGPLPSSGNGQVYIGVDSGSDLETYGYQSNPNYLPYAEGDKRRGLVPPRLRGQLPKKPLYKVGYLNSKDFARELGNMNADAIYTYQQYMESAGLLPKYAPGQMDKSTRSAFKELFTRANQHAGTWQSELESLIAVGGQVGAAGKERDPFQAVLDDPVTLRETFQRAVQSIYGGDLPDDEVDAMVNAYRAQQEAKQRAAYDAAGTTTAVDKEIDPQDYAVAEVKAKHPQQLDRVKFQDTFSQIMSTFGGGQ